MGRDWIARHSEEGLLALNFFLPITAAPMDGYVSGPGPHTLSILEVTAITHSFQMSKLKLQGHRKVPEAAFESSSIGSQSPCS